MRLTCTTVGYGCLLVGLCKTTVFYCFNMLQSHSQSLQTNFSTNNVLENFLLVPRVFIFPYFINCVCSYILVETNRHTERKKNFWYCLVLNYPAKTCLTRSILDILQSFRRMFSATPCSLPSPLHLQALFAALGIAVNIAEGAHSVSLWCCDTWAIVI